MSTFISDIQAVRERARKHIEAGAVTEAYKGDRAQVIKLLNEILATELVCVLRYKAHYFIASGPNSESIKSEFLEHAAEEQAHADAIANRITQLNGRPDFNPKTLATRSHSEYIEGNSLAGMITEDLVAERIAIDTYTEVLQWLGDADPTTRRLIEEILAKEEEHAEELAALLATMAGDRMGVDSPMTSSGRRH
jgi:bacterioferritin